MATVGEFILRRLTDWGIQCVSGDLRLEASQVLPDLPYARYAELLGLEGIRVDDVGPGRDRALAEGRPAALEVITDPEVPPLPPHIQFAQARGSAGALRGDPAARQMIRESLNGKLAELTTR